MPIKELYLKKISVKLFYYTKMDPVWQKDATFHKSEKVNINFYIVTLFLFQNVNVTIIYISENCRLFHTLQRNILIFLMYKKHQIYI